MLNIKETNNFITAVNGQEKIVFERVGPFNKNTNKNTFELSSTTLPINKEAWNILHTPIEAIILIKKYL